MDRRTEDALGEVMRMTQAIEETIFKRYPRLGKDSNLGNTVVFYDDYKAILEEIEQSGLREWREESHRRLLVWKRSE